MFSIQSFLENKNKQDSHMIAAVMILQSLYLEHILLCLSLSLSPSLSEYKTKNLYTILYCSIM